MKCAPCPSGGAADARHDESTVPHQHARFAGSAECDDIAELRAIMDTNQASLAELREIIASMSLTPEHEEPAAPYSVTEAACCDGMIGMSGGDRLARTQARLLKKIGRMELRHAEHKASTHTAKLESNGGTSQRVGRFPLHRAVADGQSASVTHAAVLLAEPLAPHVVECIFPKFSWPPLPVLDELRALLRSCDPNVSRHDSAPQASGLAALPAACGGHAVYFLVRSRL